MEEQVLQATSPLMWGSFESSSIVRFGSDFLSDLIWFRSQMVRSKMVCFRTACSLEALRPIRSQPVIATIHSTITICLFLKIYGTC